MNDKLPTAEQLYETAFYDKSYDSQHGFINMKQRVVHIVESHTQAHTEGLRERVKELEDVIRRSRNRLGNILSDDDLTDEALREHSERLLPSIHDDLNRVIYKEEMK